MASVKHQVRMQVQLDRAFTWSDMRCTKFWPMQSFGRKVHFVPLGMRNANIIWMTESAYNQRVSVDSIGGSRSRGQSSPVNSCCAPDFGMDSAFFE